jgi:hypothetical protein
MKSAHPYHVPPSRWSASKLQEHEKYWNVILQKSKNDNSKSKVTSGASSESGRGSVQQLFRTTPNSTLTILEQLNLITESIAIGYLPVCFASNRGLYHLVEGYNHGKYPRGLGDTAIKAHIDKNFQDIINGRKIEFEELLHMDDFIVADHNDRYKYCRLFAVQHDCWGSRAAKSFLGVIISFINSWDDDEKWSLESIPLSCEPFDTSHTSANILKTTEKVLKMYNIPLHYLSSSTQDTAANAFGSFADVPIVLQNPCAAHRFNLFLQHGFNNTPSASRIIDSVHRLMTRLKGLDDKFLFHTFFV